MPPLKKIRTSKTKKNVPPKRRRTASRELNTFIMDQLKKTEKEFQAIVQNKLILSKEDLQELFDKKEERTRIENKIFVNIENEETSIMSSTLFVFRMIVDILKICLAYTALPIKYILQILYKFLKTILQLISYLSDKTLSYFDFYNSIKNKIRKLWQNDNTEYTMNKKEVVRDDKTKMLKNDIINEIHICIGLKKKNSQYLKTFFLIAFPILVYFLWKSILRHILGTCNKILTQLYPTNIDLTAATAAAATAVQYSPTQLYPTNIDLTAAAVQYSPIQLFQNIVPVAEAVSMNNVYIKNELLDLSKTTESSGQVGKLFESILNKVNPFLKWHTLQEFGIAAGIVAVSIANSLGGAPIGNVVDTTKDVVYHVLRSGYTFPFV